MSANVDIVRFKLACNHGTCFGLFRKISSFWQNLFFLQKMPYGLGQDISCIKCLVVSDFETVFK